MPNYSSQLERLAQKVDSRVAVFGPNLPALARLVSKLMEGAYSSRRVLILTPTAVEAEDLVGDLSFFWPEGRVELLPAMETKPYLGLMIGPGLMADRLKALHTLASAEDVARKSASPAVVVSSVSAAMRLVPAPALLSARTMTISLGDEPGFYAVADYLAANGYHRVGQVESVADYSIRGGIIDVFPAGEPRPVRLDFFGDNVDTLRSFRVDDQRSVENLSQVVLPPACESPRDKAGLEAGAAAVEKLAKERDWLWLMWEPIARNLQEGLLSSDLEDWGPLWAPKESTIFDYLKPQATALVLHEPDRLLEAARTFWLGLSNHFARLQVEERPHLPLSTHSLDPDLLAEKFAEVPAVLGVHELPIADKSDYAEFLDFPAQSNSSLKAQASAPGRSAGLLGPLAARVKNLLGQGLKVNLVLRTREQMKRLAELLVEYDLSPDRLEGGFREDRPGDAKEPGREGGFNLLVGQLSAGFVAPGEMEAFISEDEIFGSRNRVRRRAAEEFRGLKGFGSLRDLSSGDYVVHAEHGIGQYQGLISLTLSTGQKGDFLHLVYRGGDILYVPVERFASVGKYVGASDRPPTLDKLGSGSWEKLKSKVKEELRQMAEELLKLYAARQASPGFAFSKRDQALREFEAAFEYDATPDQERSIDEVLEDLSAPKPMDRLVCGDVGYGKTEVAMRAAFKVVSEGKQVAVLVPTTILAEQHENSFAERFKDWPVIVASMSRFKKPKDQRRILEGLSKGTVDIVIGTHRLLSKDVNFKDLGLLVIDEEHRFGVVHKEKLKKLRTSVDVLSMSATPIPRSLSMSMNGVRDLSIIETSPLDRLAVKTSLMKRDDDAIVEAIDKELARGGQVFLVHNRIRDIYLWVANLQRLMPLTRFGVGHGQMSSNELEAVMTKFFNHEIDVWVTTSIVESGLDFPLANTIIIDRADLFGLAQLYQLRGRVGRGHLQAYCHLMVDDPETLTSNARKRLKALLDHVELGSGYQIAQHDLQIRGSGNILGAAQSGRASLVGFEMYSQMMEQAIMEMKNETYLEDYEPEVIMGLPAYLPAKYVPDTEMRLVLYRRLSFAKSREEVEEIASEMKDRLGQLPMEALNLLDLMEVKILLKKARARRLEGGSEGLTLTFGEEGPADYEKIMDVATKSPKNKLTPSGKLFVDRSGYLSSGRPLAGVKDLLFKLS
ncbi:MAG: transcription-repair coupling factor [Deltaproteobacteria bacterium]|jgi:transcription-repair coupling factor (superfamily II helicase)|nr:transcription-repair coupling factor [Deltaproteobacteria bacterium]